ncbi:RagB/SusD family nutrient uptake outer membrane protein [Niabella hibiscisoli]|uniref:RagB/SusD family nutrient uptake outer membrane protein n=1 Tax=Niabella hibiscisoli TaxID=1825928 RepID=UPI001F0EB9E7|nr:RagB/SusD family nutrient uptake outer membrane protein [Niabella hibiscisoli]MCH5718287.1 RagB/SusD family nutrient uptake outer membrane protein [Niabella hibiscisoli]
MQHKKYSLYSFLLLSIVSGFLASCKKFLDVEPKTATSDQVTIVDEASARTAVRGIYNQLESNDYYGYNFPLLGNLSGDNVQYTGSQAVNKTLTTHTVRADLGPLASVWTSIYNTINRANNVIDKVPSLNTTTTFTEAVRNQLTGEAYFLRALAYFDLVRTWGGVQLILKPTQAAGSITNVARSSAQDSYAQILKDLEAAETLLPGTTNRIRATKKTVWALRARYHLYLKEWAAAIDYAGRLIGDTENYGLLTPYSTFFANNASNTRESIFELYYNTTVTNTQAYNWQPSSRGGIGWVRPSDAFATVLSNAATVGDRTQLLINVPANGIATWYGNLYYRTNGTDPAYIIRLAELYLIRAEARASLPTPDITGSREDLNKIRNRANLGSLSLNTAPELLTAIENENRYEFAFENHRWYDLVRTGRAQAVLGITDATKLLLPIPYSQILVDGSLTQNPGYGN